MTQPGVLDPYSGVTPWLTTPPTWVPDEDKRRIAAYSIYDEMYWSHISSSYKVMVRGLDEEDTPIYVPQARIIVETLNRYIGKGLGVTSVLETGTPQTRVAAEAEFKRLFARERFLSKYNSNKRFGLLRGDWVWHIMADPNKPQGSRIRIMAVDPASYFAVFESDVVEGGDPERVVKVHLADRIQRGDNFIVRRQTYERVLDSDGVATILSSLTEHEEEKWFGDEEATLAVIRPPTPLPPQVTAIPVYHIPNFAAPGEYYGSSEVRGLEVLSAAVNQSTTDTDLALALMGLGVYATDEPASPRDARTGEPRDWLVYPGAVIENSKGLHRVEGITSISPYDSHIGRLEGWIRDASGAVEAAMGRIDVTAAESGVALALRMSPTLSKAEEKDRTILDVHEQMFHDLKAWLLAYESVNLGDVQVIPTLGDKLPTNRQAEAELVGALVEHRIMSRQSARKYLEGKGFVGMFAEDEEARLMAEAVMLAEADQGTNPLALRAEEEGADDAVDAPEAV